MKPRGRAGLTGSGPESVRSRLNRRFNRGGTRLGVLEGTVLFLMLVAPLAAQNRLYVLESGDRYCSVLKVSGGRSYIREKGELVAATGQRFALRKVEEYLPVFITVRDKEVRTVPLHQMSADAPVTNEFQFSAKFEAAYALEDVFLVLELGFANVGKNIFVYEIGQLEPRVPKPFSVDLPLERNLGLDQFTLHLFVGGLEVFQSEQPAAYRDEMLDRMIAKRIASVRQADPKPFFGSAPEYPAALRKIGSSLHISQVE